MISVVTINKNNKKGLEKTINSVLSQTIYDDVEYVIIDGNSSDGSKEILEKYKDKLSFAISEDDSGRYDAMNKGVKNAHGDYVLFLNSGDYFYSDNVLATLSENATEDVVYGDIIVSYRNGSYVQKYSDTIEPTYFLTKSLPHPASLIKRQLLLDEPYYEDLDIVSDWCFFYKKLVIEKRSYRHVNCNVSVFGLDGISSTNNKQLMEEKEVCYKRLAEAFPYKVIVSLTTWTRRLNYVHETIKSLLNQTHKPDKIYLILSREELKDVDLPKNLTSIEDEAFEIIWVDKDTKTMKKVLPILDKVGQDDVIINSDDDVIFEKDFIEARLIDYTKTGYSRSISSQPRFYWMNSYFSGCGSLMPRHSLNGYEEFVNQEVLETYEDDWVYSFLHLLNGDKFVICSRYDVYAFNFVHQECSSKDMGLYNTQRTSMVMQKRVKELTNMTIQEIVDKNNK